METINQKLNTLQTAAQPLELENLKVIFMSTLSFSEWV